MLRLALAALMLMIPATAQAFDGFRHAGITLEGGGHPSGGYLSARGEARAVHNLGWGELGLDLALSSAGTEGRDLTTAGALARLSFTPVSWATVGPYGWLGYQQEGGVTHGVGVEAAVMTDSGWGGEFWIGETWGGVLGERNYATNKGLRLNYLRNGRFSGHAELSKDTVNLDVGDADFYRLSLGLDTWVDLSAGERGNGGVLLSVAVGQNRFDRIDRSDSWLSVGFSVPLQGRDTPRPAFSSRRGVTHYLPMP